ncbi:MAG TPA: GAF domain-containing sensor histidine kinase [Solirubrobacteraceae bacterium]|nr:GAF domain-containing sensor histidine kinase [Solirubrobacteraceae bacterium]
MDERALRTLIDLGRRVLEESELEPVLQRVLAVARELTGARYAALGVLDARRTELERFLTAGIDEDARREIGDLPRGHGVLGEMIREPKPLRLADVGAHVRSYGFPIGHPPMSSFLGVPLIVRGEAWGNLYLTEKEGGEEFTDEDEQAAVMLADWAVIAIGNARRLEEVSSRRDELERTVTAMRATAEISRVLAGETDLEVVLGLIAKRGRALVGARALVIELAVADRLQIAAVAGEVDPALVGRELSIDPTVAGHVLRTRRPQRLTDDVNRARFEESGLGALGLTARAGLFVPLGFRAETPGVLAVFDPLAGAEFTADDERLLSSFATSAASAVVTARSVTVEQLRARELATEQERRRWARELHDETLQGLGALRLGLSTARRTDDPERWRTAVDDAVLQLDTEIANLRGIISDVRPAALDELGVAAALESLVDRMRSRGLDVELALDLDFEAGRSVTRHAEDVETAIYRIVQESLNNVLKHAATDAVVVDVVEAAGTIAVRVTDEGRGFDTASQGTGFGLVGIRERAGLLGGTAEIASVPGQGTTVTARLPVRRRGADQPLRAPDPAADTAAATRSAASSSRT